MGGFFSKPWRDTDIKWNANMCTSLQNDVTKNRKKPLNILLFGNTGQGKSTFVNTVYSALYGKQKSYAAVALNVAESITLGIQEYQLKGPTMESNVILYDMQGVEHSIKSKDTVEVLDAILSSRQLPSEETGGKNFSIGKPIHALIICQYFVQNFELRSDAAFYKKCVITASHKRVPVFLLITKIDTACLSTDFKTSNVFYTPEFGKTVEEAAKSFGIPEKNILLQHNYHAANHQRNQTDIDVLTLYNLRYILDNIES